ncbi:uncharacterized protein MEPE_00602 [Melanopsichium pennsylvanicum]|uniref:Uncharacterized protein n=2 Tax=Melanopsichium pennsylvanicum TaxID=63383 RepID=A0AAJ4XGY7_9BASI|nr:uncharacterized protein MEPE_00602 [Melanopsichium pennsylvanicum]
MSRRESVLVPHLGSPGSLKAVFGTTIAHDSTTPEEFVDDILPDFAQSSILGPNAAFGRRSRLDDSAGEGLRRNVLVRNAMLSSLERERRQMAKDASVMDPTVSTTVVRQSSSITDMDDEAQFFEDLLSELSGSECCDAKSLLTEPRTRTSTDAVADQAQDDEDDCVQLDSELQLESVLTQPVDLASPDTTDAHQAQQHEIAVSSVPALVDYCSSAIPTAAGFADSGFAEETSRPASAASYCTGYPNVCPYPAVGSYVGGSSEELPALIDDDSDVDDDEDEVDEQGQGLHQPAMRDERPSGPQGSLVPDGDATLSRPLSPITSPVHSVCADFASFRDPLSPEPSRPTSPISSASSKGDGDGPSPLLIPTDSAALPSLAELTLQLPATTRVDLMTRPSRVCTWFEHKQEAPNGASSSADRIRWTTSPATYFRPLPAPPDFQLYRSSLDPHRSIHATASLNDPSDQSIVVHWSH